MEKITCFNRDLEGECLAYNKGVCSPDCPARITTVEQKIELLKCLLKRSQARKDQRRLEEELEAAYKVKEAKDQGKYEGWMKCYMEDMHRGEKGGASESDSNRKTGLKQLMKDNRPVGVKPTKAQLEEYKEELTKWEEENGKLEKLGRTSMSHSRVNSYTGVPICFSDHGLGHCNGRRSAAGRLGKECKDCDYFRGGAE